ncbi:MULTISPECIES: hypothetical protein [Haloferax]|uniref:Uncharacterized protein n=1 Tax=Haloferax marinum TaxID=2666143 RepID=A0A6A8GAK8_9EURY|nr:MULTISPECIES: hypothetical protein [Haloferax]KAB1198047.1 hypothetical protein Hfx1150_11150 [Haloferax sp. CBA1150]MRW97116.1 hypothetical protein [Haloferax marinum]
MPTLTDFVIALLQSVVELVINFVDVALNDPLSPLLMLVGGAFIVLSVGMFTYVTLGALAAELGIGVTPGSRGTPSQRE